MKRKKDDDDNQKNVLENTTPKKKRKISNGIMPINVSRLSYNNKTPKKRKKGKKKKNGKKTLLEYNFKNPVKLKNFKNFVNIYDKKHKGKFDLIYADPPWDYPGPVYQKSRSGSTHKSYDTMTIHDICKVPVKEISKENSVLLMWTTAFHQENAFKVFKAWGYTYVTIWLVWVKSYENGPHTYLGCGTYNRQGAEFILVGVNERVNKKVKHKFLMGDVHKVEPIGPNGETKVFLDECEYLLLGKRGRILPYRCKDQGKVFSNVLHHPVDRTKHSKKPIKVIEEMIPKVFPNVKMPIELFSRSRTKWNGSDGKYWYVWGDDPSIL